MIAVAPTGAAISACHSSTQPLYLCNRPAAAAPLPGGPESLPAQQATSTHALRASAAAAAAAGASRRWRRHWAQRRAAAGAVTGVAVSDDEVGSDEKQVPLLNDAWEHLLSDALGDIFSEPQVFADIVGPLNGPAVGESVGSVRFERVSAKDTEGDILLYVPGIDFAGVFASRQFKTLAKEGHELWRCFVGPDDRTPFALMVRNIGIWVQARVEAGRRVVLIGESFGGLLCLAVGLSLSESLGASALKGLVLINPATSFERTPWALLGRALTALPASGPLPPPAARTDAELLQEMNDRFAQTPYAFLGGLALLGSVADASQIGRAASRMATTFLDASGTEPSRNETLAAFLTYPEKIAMMLPPDTMRFRLRAWLRDGCEAVNSELRGSGRSGVRPTLPPTLLVISTGDRLLSSATEGLRLTPLLEWRCGSKFFKCVELGEDVGHAPLDGRLDLAALLNTSPLYKPPAAPRDYVSSYVPPSLDELEKGSSSIENLASLLSPVFCSRDATSVSRRFGLAGVPDPSVEGRPVLLVGNHQLLALDLGPLVREFLVEKGFAPRGLAHPINFPDVISDMLAGATSPPSPGALTPLDALGMPFELRSVAKASLEAARALAGERTGVPASRRQGFPGFRARDADDTKRNTDAQENAAFGRGFAKWGAVPVTPRNFIRLLSRGEAVLLFPGGAPEACHGPFDKYRLMWPEKTDFVRAAAKYNAIVVPFGGVGCADNFTHIPQEWSEGLRSVSSRMRASDGDLDRAVRGGGLLPVSEALEQGPSFPGVLPRLSPSQQNAAGFGDRMYVSFGQPVDLRNIDHKDREACEKVYANLQVAVEDEIAWLLEARTRDPYRDFVRRQAYERIANLDPVPRTIGGGPLKGRELRSCGRRAPTFEL